MSSSLDDPETTVIAPSESPLRFAVLREHVSPGLERIVEEREGYVVVEKHERFRHVIDQASERWAVERDGERG